MKKSTPALLAFSFYLLVSLLLSSCRFNGNVKFEYQHPDRYSVGDATIGQAISDISVDWFSGSVNICYSDNPEVRIYEEADTTLNDTLRMRHYVDEDGTLNIQFCQNGISLNSKKLKKLQKRLTIEVPRSISLDEIEIDAVNVDVDIDSVVSRELTVDGVNSNVTAFYPTLPDEIHIDGVNSTLTIHVPPTAGMTVDMDGVNTDFQSDLPVGKTGKKHTLGDGKCELDIDAVNCSLHIKELF